MNLLVRQTSLLQGQVTPPSSKSQTIRGLVFGLLAKGRSVLLNPLDSDDARDAIRACQQLGAVITTDKDRLVIESQGCPLLPVSEMIHSGNSGITTRFILPALGLRQNAQQPIILDCGEQMRTRPIRPMVDALVNLGLNIEYLNQSGSCPIAISGSLQGGATVVDGLSSQYLSALLINLPCAPNDSEISVQNLHERPYVEMTLAWLQQQNIQYTHELRGNIDIYRIKGKQFYQPFEKLMPGDYSSASCLLIAAALLNGEVILSGLMMQDLQGDKRLIDILKMMGADITVQPTQIVVRGGKALVGLSVDANAIPDLLPALAVLGTYATGKTEIRNVKQARIKETDRIHSMLEGLTRMGAHVEEHADGLTIYHSKLKGAAVRGFDDHRTVMSLAVAGLLADGVTTIDDAESINKTFPTFVKQMQTLGAKLELVDANS